MPDVDAPGLPGGYRSTHRMRQNRHGLARSLDLEASVFWRPLNTKHPGPLLAGCSA